MFSPEYLSLAPLSLSFVVFLKLYLCSNKHSSNRCVKVYTLERTGLEVMSVLPLLIYVTISLLSSTEVENKKLYIYISEAMFC